MAAPMGGGPHDALPQNITTALVDPTGAAGQQGSKGAKALGRGSRRGRRRAGDGAPATALAGAEVKPKALGGAAPIRLVKPVPGQFTSGFGARGSGSHHGLDMAAPVGTPFKAAAAGVVEKVASDDVYGWYTVVRHAGGMRTLYAHQDQRPPIQQGQNVRAGQVIGVTGNSGKSTGPHLHFEVRKGASIDTAVDPLPYLRP